MDFGTKKKTPLEHRLSYGLLLCVMLDFGKDFEGFLAFRQCQ